METKTFNTSIRSKALNNGLILGCILFVLSILVFYLITSITNSIWMISFAPLIFSVILPIVAAVFLCIDLRKKLGGYWTLRQATTGIFIMFILAYAVQAVGRDLIFAKLIEPDMVQKTETAIVNSTSAMMEKSGLQQDEIDKKTETIEKQFDEQKNQSAGKIIQGIAINIVLIFAVSLIFAAILKKEPPLFTVNDAPEA